MAIHVMVRILVYGLAMLLAKLYDRFDRWMHRRKKWEKDVAVAVLAGGILALGGGAWWVSRATITSLWPPAATVAPLEVLWYRLQPLEVGETPAVVVAVKVNITNVSIREAYLFQYSWLEGGKFYRPADGSTFIVPNRELPVDQREDLYARMTKWREHLDEMWEQNMMNPDRIKWSKWEPVSKGSEGRVQIGPLSMRATQRDIDQLKIGERAVLVTGLIQYSQNLNDIRKVSVYFSHGEVHYGKDNGFTYQGKVKP